MQLSLWRLASHVVGTNYPTFRIRVKLSNGFGANYQIGAPGQIPALVNLFVPPVLFPHFPYGVIVDPD